MNVAEGILVIGADGVVRNIFDHPVCASKVASQLFLIAQPPLLYEEGTSSCFNDFIFGQHALKPRLRARLKRYTPCTTASDIWPD